MSLFRTLLTAGLLLGGVCAGSLQAAPALPQPGLTADSLLDTVAYRHRRHGRVHRHRAVRHGRRLRRWHHRRHHARLHRPAERSISEIVGELRH